MQTTMHSISCTIPVHCSGIAPSEINDYTALKYEWNQLEQGIALDGSTSGMSMLTPIFIWVISIFLAHSPQWNQVCSPKSGRRGGHTACMATIVPTSRMLRPALRFQVCISKGFMLRHLLCVWTGGLYSPEPLSWKMCIFLLWSCISWERWYPGGCNCRIFLISWFVWAEKATWSWNPTDDLAETSTNITWQIHSEIPIHVCD